MKHSMKRLLSLLLALIFCVSLFPAAALAEEPGEIAPAETADGRAAEGGGPYGGDAGEIAPAEDPDALPPRDGADEPAEVIASGTCGDDLTWTLSDAGLLTISGTGAMADYTYSNTAQFFEYRNKIKALKIESGVTSIGNFAFRSCYNMTSTSIPESVTSIGQHAFDYCYALTEVKIPASVTSIETSAFNYCSELASIIVTSGNTAYSSEDGVLYNKDMTELLCCPGGKSGVCSIPASVESIFVYYAFFECGKLTGISVASGNTAYSSEDGVLYNKDKTKLLLCPRAKSGVCTIPDGVASVEDYAFQYCEKLTEIRIPDSVTSFGNYCFYYCTALESVTIPKGVKTLNPYVFSDCYALTSITIPAAVTSIMYGALYKSGLTEIRFLGSAPSFANDVFKNVTATAYYPLGDDTWTESVRQNYGGTITWVAKAAANQCGDNVFWTLEDGVLTISGTGPMWDFNNPLAPTYLDLADSIRYVVVEEGVTRVGNFAFIEFTGISGATIADSVTEIGKGAFSVCLSLQEIELGSGLRCIESYAFDESALRSVTIPAGVEFIDDYAFACDYLTEIVFLGSAPESGGYRVFNNVEAVAYYPAEDPSWTETAKEELAGAGDITWVAVEPALPTYTVSFDVQGHGTAPTAQTVEQGSTATRPADPTATGWTFGGWYREAACTNAYDFSTPVTADLTLYAKWTPITRTVRFDANGHGTAPASQMVAYGGTATRPADPTAEGWTFGGWYTEAACTNVYDFSTPVTVNITLYAKWTEAGVSSGQCGDDVYWSLENGVLTITGTGPMWDYSNDWPTFYSLRDSITSLVIENGVTAIGEWAFFKLEAMTSVTIPSSVTSIASAAFNSCTSLTGVTIPESVSSIGDRAFSTCSGLTEIRFEGSAPSFGNYVFNYVTTTAYYPANDASWTEEVRQNYGGTITWVAYEPGSCASGHAWGEPSWAWAEDLSSAAATFVCARDSSHTQTVEATVEKSVSGCTVTYTATVSFEGNTYTDVRVKEYEARFTSATLNLEDLVEIRFKLLVSGDADLSKLTVKYTMENSADMEIPVKDLPKEGDRYLVKVPVVAKRMTDEILIWVVDENDEIVSNQVPYSVETYCLNKLEKGSDQKLMDLCAALLNYGAYAQLYLNYHTEKLANRNLMAYNYSTDVSAVTVPASSALVTGETAGIKAKSAALVLDAATVLRYRFTPDEGEKMENFVFTCNGVTYTPVETTVSGVKVYQVDVPGIAAKDLDQRYPMKVTKDGAGDLQIDYGVLTYLYSKQDSSNENLAKLCRAMYQYHLMAKAYFQK